MAKLNFVEKARKDYPEQGIKRGESYYWWQFRFGGKHMSKTKPRRSRLTQSEFYSTMYDAEDDLDEACNDLRDGKSHHEDLASMCEEKAQEIRDLGDECQSKFDNMPEGLQQGDTGQMLEARVEACESIADALESAASNIRDLIPDEEDTKDQEDIEDKVAQACSEVESVGWDYE